MRSIDDPMSVSRGTPFLIWSTTAAVGDSPEVDRHLQLLTHADEHVRSDAVMQLGRMRADRAPTTTPPALPP